MTSGKNGTVLTKSTSSTDATTVIQTAMNDVNNTSINNGRGGWIDVDCGTYPVTTALKIPRNGNMTFTGHGVGCTIFTVPSPHKNDFMEFYRTSTGHSSFFNYFAHFQVTNWSYTNTPQNNTGFNLNSTSGGIVDSIFEDLFLQYFSRDDVLVGDQNTWNNKWNKNIFEHSGRYLFYITGGSDTRITDNKFLFSHGTYALVLQGATYETVMGNWFYQNDKTAIDIAQAASTNNLIIGNKITSSSFAGSGQGNDIVLDGGASNSIIGNTFAGNLVNYNIALTGGTATNRNLISENVLAPTVVISKILITNNANVVGKCNLVINNFGWPSNNTIGTCKDPSRGFIISGASNLPSAHIFNQTLPAANGTISLVPRYNFTEPLNQTGTSSTTFVMLKAFATLTPKYSTNATITVQGYTSNNLANDGCKLQIQTGTSYLGNNGAAITGTTVGRNFELTSPTAIANMTFSKTVVYTGDVAGTKQFFDLAAAARTGGVCNVRNIDWYITENP